MRRVAAVLFVVALAFLGGLPGCVNEETLSPSTHESFRLDSEELGDRALLNVSLVQAPLGDPFLDRRIWTGADQMILSADKRDLLEANGFRIGILVGAPPEALMNLLQTERTCVDRQGRVAPSGVTVNQALLTTNEPIECRVQHVGRIEKLGLDRPTFSLDLTPKRLGESKIRLRLVPRIETGDKITTYKPVPEESKWALVSKRAGQALTELASEVELLSNQVLIVGCRSEREESVGYASFVRVDGPEPMQRLLVVRHLRPSAMPAGATTSP